MKDSLVFDTSDANTILDSDNVGAFLRSSDGTLLTHTQNGAKEALDVNIAASDIQIDVDLVHTEDSVRLGDGTSFFTSTSENGDIALDVHLSNSSIAVTATDLDIRDLAFASDSVTAHQGGTWTIDSITNDVNVTATDLDVRDLSASQDNIAISDGTDTLAINADGSINVNVASIEDAALADTAIAAGASVQAVASTAVDVVSSPLANRKYLYIYNNDNRKMYVGPSGVTEANGFPVSPSSYMELRAGASVDIEFVSAKAGHALRYMELS